MKKKKVQTNVNLETLAGGAFAEKINEALAQVAENILNPNTEASAKRGIQINIKFSPNKTRQVVNTTISVTTKLATTEAIDTQMVMGLNLKNGQIEIAEYDGQIRGQLGIQDVMEQTDETAAEEDPAPTHEQLQNNEKPLDLRKRGKSSENIAVPGRDYDPDTGEVYEPASQVIEFTAKAAQA